MSCSSNRLCNNLVISSNVTFNSGTGNLEIDIPAGNYANCQKYCIVVAQALPTTTTINAPVVITIGGVTQTTYPLVNPNGTAVYASEIATRTRYCTQVHTDIAAGVFQLVGRTRCSCCSNRTVAPSLPAATA